MDVIDMDGSRCTLGLLKRRRGVPIPWKFWEYQGNIFPVAISLSMVSLNSKITTHHDFGDKLRPSPEKNRVLFALHKQVTIFVVIMAMYT